MTVAKLPLTLVYKDFPEEIQISAKRRVKYFRRGSDALPKKYLFRKDSDPKDKNAPLGADFTWKPHTNKEVRLFDTVKNEFVIKNPTVASKPRFITIAGNDIMRMHEQVLFGKVIPTLNSYFAESLGTYSHSTFSSDGPYKKETKHYNPFFTIENYPLRIHMEIHTFPRYANWDLSNLWIYNKCFEDAMQIVGVIPNDDIRRITLPGAPQFIPVTKESDRKIVFYIEEETKSEVLDHLLFWSQRKGKLERPIYGQEWIFERFRLDFTRKGKAGDLIIDTKWDDSTEFKERFNLETNENARRIHMTVNMGKDAKQAVPSLTRVRHQCYQLSMIPEVSSEMWAAYEAQLTEIFLNIGIPVAIWSPVSMEIERLERNLNG